MRKEDLKNEVKNEHQVTYLMRLCHWMVKQRLGGIVKWQRSFRATKDRNLSHEPNILKRHST